MEKITLDQFLENPQEITVKASTGEDFYQISVPGSSNAVLINEQYLMELLSMN